MNPLEQTLQELAGKVVANNLWRQRRCFNLIPSENQAVESAKVEIHDLRKTALDGLDDMIQKAKDEAAARGSELAQREKKAEEREVKITAAQKKLDERAASMSDKKPKAKKGVVGDLLMVQAAASLEPVPEVPMINEPVPPVEPAEQSTESTSVPTTDAGPAPQE